MDELAPGTMRVKHKQIPQIPFIIIESATFDPSIHEKIVEKEVDKPIISDNNNDQIKADEAEDEPEITADTIRVRHKQINVPFIIINKSDFDPEIHSLFTTDDSESGADDSSSSAVPKMIAADGSDSAITDDSESEDDSTSADDSESGADDSFSSAVPKIITTDDSDSAITDDLESEDGSTGADDSESENTGKAKRGRKKAVTE